MTQLLAAAAAVAADLLLSIEQIAEVCHEANRAYCAALGDDSQPAWADAPDWQRQSAMNGVQMHLADPQATPEQSHEAWLAQKAAEGWKYGEVKDPAKKEHPCFRPYAELPTEQKAKDYIFRGVVHALAGFPKPAAPVAPIAAASGAVHPAARAATASGMVAVQYIGKRPVYREAQYGTGLVFTQGEVKLVRADKAAQMLAHADVYVPGNTSEAAGPAEEAPEKPARNLEEENLQDLRDSVANMTKEACKAFAQQHFRQQLDDKLKVAEMRAQVTQWIDQFGVA